MAGERQGVGRDGGVRNDTLSPPDAAAHAAMRKVTTDLSEPDRPVIRTHKC